MAFSEEQLSNAPSPILVTPFGITMDVREEQQSKVASPIVVTPSGRTIEVRDTQFSKALSNTRYAIGDGDGGQRFAIIESVLVYICNEIGDFFEHHSLGNNDIPLITISLCYHLCGLSFLVEAVFDTVDNFFYHGMLVIYCYFVFFKFSILCLAFIQCTL